MTYHFKIILILLSKLSGMSFESRPYIYIKNHKYIFL